MASPAKELKAFLEFLKSLWAILAQISVLFPYSSEFFDLIPTKRIEPGYPLYYLPPLLIPMVATLFCAFIILRLFNQRGDYGDLKKRPILMRNSMLYFFWGIIGLLMYFGLRNIDVGDVMYKIGLGEPIKPIVKFIIDTMMLCCYCLFFGMITKAFMLQGIITYYGRSERQA